MTETGPFLPFGPGWRPIIPTTREVKEYSPRNDVLVPILQALTISVIVTLNLTFGLASIHAWRRTDNNDSVIIVGIFVCVAIIGAFLGIAGRLQPLSKRDPWLARLVLLTLLLAIGGLGFGFYQLAQGEALLDIQIAQAVVIGLGVPISFALGITMTTHADFRAGMGFLLLGFIFVTVLYLAMPRFALSPAWPYGLSALSLGSSVGGVVLGYNFIRERFNEWLPLHPMDAVLMEWVKSQRPIPEEEHSIWIPHENAGAYYRLPGLLSKNLDDVRDFVHDALRDQLAVDKTLPRNRFHDIATTAETYGWIELRNPRSRKDGYTLTTPGRGIFKKIEEQLQHIKEAQ